MAVAFATLLVAGAGCSSADLDAASAPDASVGTFECVDQDGDGFGSGCALGPDCDDASPEITDQCYRCATPGEGCPCSEEGATVACGEEASRTETEVTCAMGQRVCQGGAWSACAGSDDLDPESYPTKGLGGVSGCPGNPCDPYCKSFPDTPDGTLTNDAGVVGTDSGLTVVPTAVDAGPPTSCASTTAEALPVQLDIAVMFDRSGSMAGTRWTSAANALKTYAASADAKGVGMALNYFPEPVTTKKTCCFLWYCYDCSSTSWSCNVSDYQKFDVGMGLLPGNLSGHAITIRNSIDATSPDGPNTPTLPALQGALNYAKGWATSNPTHKTIVVLATDGQPNGCSSSVTNTASAAAAGFSGSPSIPTYVIGVGGSLSSLDTIAKAGSGGKESYIPVPSGSTSAFIDAMKKIRVKAGGCDYILPTPPSGDLEPNATDVRLKNLSTGTSSTLPKLAGPSACGSKHGFYYDSATAPKKLFLCPNTCSAVANTSYKVELVFKCKASCGKGAFKADPVPVGMYVMLDKSGSMGGSRWTNVTKALKDFVNNPASDGMGVGIDYFPEGGSSTYCDVNRYAAPSVPIKLLPGNRTALVSSINGQSPSGNTPTRPALEGAIKYTRSYAVANPTHKAIVVLATDGEPTVCPSISPTWIGDNVARNYGFLGSPSVPTYVIGVGSGVSSSNLDYVANRGGTGKAYMVNDGSSSSFLAAMNDIRKKSLSCEFTVPATTLGKIDPKTLQVRYVDNAGATQKVSQVGGAGSCGSGNGWYADDAAAPTRIFLCPTSCANVKALSKPELYVFYDCLNGGDGTFTRDYQIDCPVGTRAVWGYWSWTAKTPGDSSIDFTVTSASTLGGLSSAPEVPLRFTNPPGPSALVGSPIGVRSTPVNTQVGFTFVDTSLALGGLPRNTKFVRIRARMKGTTSSPLLQKWNQEVSCVPAE